ncbi:divergent polysaccharide deacetylase family protein [Halodesulfovibrio aestuarii]|uniref:Divergent polysaccharide deacetylase family protein n=1 Tax=Halodesulfovibrio aestuarii TaxID=126333 RepID=A0ABV4JU76_9BACT
MSDSRQNQPPRWPYYTLAVICCLTLVALFYALSSNSKTTTDPVAEMRAPVNFASLPYEERLDAPMEEGVKRIDYAILRALQDANVSASGIELVAIEQQRFGDETFHFQQLRINSQYTADELITPIATALVQWANKATLTKLSTNMYRVTFNDVETHLLKFNKITATTDFDKNPATLDIGGHLTIVIDDLGESISAAHSLAGLSYPVTFAIWPRSSYAKEIADIASAFSREIIIHQPMEPMSADAQPGPGAVYVDMTPEDIRATVRANFKLVPGAVGLNNHMGSKFTQNREAVREVALEAKKRGFFVLDSMTHAKSVFFNEAKRQGLIAFRRNVFIDNVKEVQSTLHQLKKAERIALAKGTAIAIGHPHPTTLLALQEWEKQRNPRVAVVKLSELLNF